LRAECALNDERVLEVFVDAQRAGAATVLLSSQDE
jgi:hypothetical protein